MEENEGNNGKSDDNDIVINRYPAGPKHAQARPTIRGQLRPPLGGPGGQFGPAPLRPPMQQSFRGPPPRGPPPRGPPPSNAGVRGNGAGGCSTGGGAGGGGGSGLPPMLRGQPPPGWRPPMSGPPPQQPPQQQQQRGMPPPLGGMGGPRPMPPGGAGPTPQQQPPQRPPMPIQGGPPTGPPGGAGQQQQGPPGMPPGAPNLSMPPPGMPTERPGMPPPPGFMPTGPPPSSVSMVGSGPPPQHQMQHLPGGPLPPHMGPPMSLRGAPPPGMPPHRQQAPPPHMMSSNSGMMRPPPPHMLGGPPQQQPHPQGPPPHQQHLGPPGYGVPPPAFGGPMPPHLMGGPPNSMMGSAPPPPPPPPPPENVWVENCTPDGKAYFYHLRSRETRWERPEGARIMTQAEVDAVAEGAAVVGGGPGQMPGAASVRQGIPSTVSSAAQPFGMAGGPAMMQQQHAQMQQQPPPPNGPAKPPEVAEWAEYRADDGRPYYHNLRTSETVWEKPAPLLAWEAGGKPPQPSAVPPSAKEPALGAPSLAAREVAVSASSGAASGGQSEIDKQQQQQQARTAAQQQQQDKSRPVKSQPVPGTPWCVVWTGDERVFFFNPSKRLSLWDRPEELVGMKEVDKILGKGAAEKRSAGKAATGATAAKKKKTAKETKKKKAEGQKKKSAGKRKRSGSEDDDDEDDDEDGEDEEDSGSDDDEVDESNEDNDEDDDEDDAGRRKAKKRRRQAAGKKSLQKKKRRRGSGSSGSDKDDEDEENDEDEEDDEDKEGEEEDEDEEGGADKPLLEREKIEPGKANAFEAEVQAARERASLPLDARMQQFREMLAEKQVSAFSTWDKELHKIVFDPRYLLLPSKERKLVFDQYMKERAEEERLEKNRKLREKKEAYKALLEEAKVSAKTTFQDFSAKWGKDERFKGIEKARERELLFHDYITEELKKLEREERQREKEKAKSDFLKLLKEQSSLGRSSRWSEVRKLIESDSRYRAVESSSRREDYFKEYIKGLDSKSDRHHSHRDAEKSGSGDGADAAGPGSAPSATAAADSAAASDEEDDAADDEETRRDRERRERQEASIREREKAVKEEMASILRERDKERDAHKHSEAADMFRALLSDMVRHPDATWRDVKKALRRDARWQACEALSRDEKSAIFDDHLKVLMTKSKEMFHKLLDDTDGIGLDATWRQVRRLIRDDPRYEKFSSHDRKREREFDAWLAARLDRARQDLRRLLEECKFVTHETGRRYEESEAVRRDLISALSKDRRYLVFEPLAAHRDRIILDYLRECEAKGPPPPPTASEPGKRK